VLHPLYLRATLNRECPDGGRARAEELASRHRSPSRCFRGGEDGARSRRSPPYDRFCIVKVVDVGGSRECDGPRLLRFGYLAPDIIEAIVEAPTRQETARHSVRMGRSAQRWWIDRSSSARSQQNIVSGSASKRKSRPDALSTTNARGRPHWPPSFLSCRGKEAIQFFYSSFRNFLGKEMTSIERPSLTSFA